MNPTPREQVAARAAADWTAIAEVVIDGPESFTDTHPGRDWGTWTRIVTDGQPAFVAARLEHFDAHAHTTPTRLDYTRVLDHERALLHTTPAVAYLIGSWS